MYHPVFFPESWSLAVEEWFYLLFPAAVWLGLRFLKRFTPVFLSVAAAFFLFSTLARMLSASNPQAGWAEWQRLIVIYRFDGLMIGVFAGWLSLRWPSFWRSCPILAASIGSLLLLAMYVTLWRREDGRWLFGPDDYFARTFRFTFVSLGFALLLPFASLWRIEKENFPALVTRKVALWSYALYLVHLPVNQLVMRYLFPDWRVSIREGVASFVLSVGLAVLISGFLFRYFEHPITRLRERAAPVVAKFFE